MEVVACHSPYVSGHITPSYSAGSEGEMKIGRENWSNERSSQERNVASRAAKDKDMIRQ